SRSTPAITAVMIELTPQQRQAVHDGEPIRVFDSDLGAEVVVVRGDRFAATASSWPRSPGTRQKGAGSGRWRNGRPGKSFRPPGVTRRRTRRVAASCLRGP